VSREEIGMVGRRRERAEGEAHRGGRGNGGRRAADSRAGGEGSGFL
jgi:hypothetical protein